MSFLSIAREAEYEAVRKGSRFVAWAVRVGSEEEVTGSLEEARKRHTDASHHCWAYRVGPRVRFSDDGEPGGTAGRPMLEVLLKRELQEVLGVVTRYYGGTKLGAGGLVRAYGGTFSKALDLAGVRMIRPRQGLTIMVAYSDMDAVHRLLDTWPGVNKGEVAFDAGGMQLSVSLLADDMERFEQALADVTRGSASVRAEGG
ncbi:MAG TPA: YigZ family protein [Trueperaceae bacterium]